MFKQIGQLSTTPDAFCVMDMSFTKNCRFPGLGFSQVMMGAAVDTTSSVLNFVLLQLAIHPAVQEKLAQELAETLHGGDLDADLTKGKTYLPYMHAVIRESVRMRPPTTSGMVKDVPVDVNLGGYNIPAGTPAAFASLF